MPEAEPDAGSGTPRRRRIDPGVVVACLVLALGLVFVFRGLSVGVTGEDRSPLPQAVESVAPVPEASQAFSRTSVFVDLIGGYTGELTIDGVTIQTVALEDVRAANPVSGQQVELPPVTIYESGNATLTFTPSAAAPIDEFTDGLHTVRLSYWPVTEGRQAARTFTWTFTVV